MLRGQVSQVRKLKVLIAANYKLNSREGYYLYVALWRGAWSICYCKLVHMRDET